MPKGVAGAGRDNASATTRRLVPTGAVRIAPTMAIPSLLLEHGVDPVALLAEFGLAPAQFDEPESVISYASRARLLSRCAEAARCPHFGLLVGQRAGLSSFGLVGFLMQSAPDVRGALQVALEHFQLHNPNASVELIENDGFAHFGHTILRPDFVGREQVVDMSAAIMFNVLRMLCGHGEQPSEIRFARSRPPDMRPYQRFFRARLVFDASDTGLTAPARWLDRPLATADPLLHLMMRQRVMELVTQAGEGIVSRLRRQLPGLLAGRDATVTAAARNLGLAVRTLNRRLAAEGTSFAVLRDEARYAMARQLLQGTAMQVSEIAAQLGYANASALTTAFRRWSGRGPAQWRAAKRRRGGTARGAGRR
jgi:AraC-like DNA-binding protein